MFDVITTVYQTIITDDAEFTSAVDAEYDTLSEFGYDA